MPVINDTIVIPDEELEWSYARSGGPGGQNVNKVSSKVLLRWRPTQSSALPLPVKERFLRQQAHRLTKGGDLLVVSQRFRDQGRNASDCLEKLREMILAALTPPKPRRPTRPTRGSVERRHSAKKHRGNVKRQRRDSFED